MRWAISSASLKELNVSNTTNGKKTIHIPVMDGITNGGKMQDELNDLVNPYYKNPDDIVSVVRCRDCRFFSELIPGTIPVCLRYGDFTENDYCSHGERR